MREREIKALSTSELDAREGDRSEAQQTQRKGECEGALRFIPEKPETQKKSELAVNSFFSLSR